MLDVSVGSSELSETIDVGSPESVAVTIAWFSKSPLPSDETESKIADALSGSSSTTICTVTDSLTSKDAGELSKIFWFAAVPLKDPLIPGLSVAVLSVITAAAPD